MANKYIGQFNEFLKDRRKLSVFLVCFTLACGFWVLKALSRDDYITTVYIPVKYANIPQNRTLLNMPPNTLSLVVEGNGFDLINWDPESISDTLVINLDRMQLFTMGEYQRGYLDPMAISDEVQGVLKGNISLHRIIADSLNFIFDLKVMREIPVQMDLQFAIAEGFMVSDDITIEPSVAQVEGPLSVLDTLAYIKTRKMELGELKETKKVAARPSYLNLLPSIEIVPDSFIVTVPVDKVTEKRLMLEPIEFNVPDSMDLLLFPQQVEVVCRVPLNRYDEAGDEHFSVYVDFDEYQEGLKTLKVHLEQWPEFVDNVRVFPAKVEFVIRKK